VVEVAPPQEPVGLEFVASFNVWLVEQTPADDDVNNGLVAEQLSFDGAAANISSGNFKKHSVINKARTVELGFMDGVGFTRI
jgi:hypothetical protein